GIAPPLVRLLTRPGCNARGHGYSGIALVRHSIRRQKACPPELHRAHTQQYPVRGDSLYASQASAEAKAERVRRTEAQPSNRPAALVGLQHVRATVVTCHEPHRNLVAGNNSSEVSRLARV